MSRVYRTFNYPSGVSGGKTLLTGIRKVENDDNNYYITGFYKYPEDSAPVASFIYKGCRHGKGTWTLLDYPSSDGATVNATNLYGPDNGKKDGNIKVVGNYTTVEAGQKTFGCLYDGPLDGSGIWTPLTPTSVDPVLNTIAHSTHGKLVVGNYDTQLNQGKAFIYDIKTGEYFDVRKDGAFSITAYGVWHNGKQSYTICGGYTNLDHTSGVDTGYVVDWDNKNRKFSNWRVYNYGNDPVKALITHFDGITSDGKGGYNLTGDWIGADNGSPGLGFIANVRRRPNGKFKKARWNSIAYPNELVTSGNSVSMYIVIGVYTSNPDDGVNGYISYLK